MNNLLKRSMKKQHVILVESRIEFDRALNNHSLNCQIKYERTRHKPLFENSHIFAPAILKKISIQIKIAESIELKQESDEIVLARHVRKPSVIYEIKDDICSCGLCIFAGYPCCHIIKHYSEIGNEFPFHLISERWIKYQIQENSSNQNTSFFENDDAILFEEEEEYFESDELNQFEFCVNDSETQTSRYLKILHKRKDLAKIASTDKMISNRVLKVLQNEINQILSIPTDSFDIDHINDMQNEEISENSPAHQENELIDRTYIETGENTYENFIGNNSGEYIERPINQYEDYSGEEIAEDSHNELLQNPLEGFIQNTGGSIQSTRGSIQNMRGIDSSEELSEDSSDDLIPNEIINFRIRDSTAKAKGKPKRGRNAKIGNMVDYEKEAICPICIFHHKIQDYHFFARREKLYK